MRRHTCAHFSGKHKLPPPSLRPAPASQAVSNAHLPCEAFPDHLGHGEPSTNPTAASPCGCHRELSFFLKKLSFPGRTSQTLSTASEAGNHMLLSEPGDFQVMERVRPMVMSE